MLNLIAETRVLAFKFLGKVLSIPDWAISIVFIFKTSLTRQDVHVKREVKLFHCEVRTSDQVLCRRRYTQLHNV